MRLFIDDERYAPAGYDVLARTNETAISSMASAKESGEKFELASFDYDAHNYLAWTFQASAEWMRDNNFWPDELRIHTANSWEGRPWLESFFKENAPKSTTLSDGDPNDFDAIMNRTAPDWVREFVEAQMR